MQMTRAAGGDNSKIKSAVYQSKAAALFSVCIKICGISATGDAPYSFYGYKDHTPNRTKGDEIMPDDFIRRMLQAVIESFPIDGAKKADMLQSIVGQEKTEEDQ